MPNLDYSRPLVVCPEGHRTNAEKVKLYPEVGTRYVGDCGDTWKADTEPLPGTEDITHHTEER